MGIPAFFKNLVQTRRGILQEASDAPVPDVLYLDANSIIYDAARECDNATGITTDEMVIDLTISKIRGYVESIGPVSETFVAFDGVAPYGKMIQQRERRWKARMFPAIGNSWDTTRITPGTPFMSELGRRCYNELASDSIAVSATDECGEGEHKLFGRLRAGEPRNIAVYGLDADLIMLSLLHVGRCKSLMLFRETPEFIKAVDPNLEPNKSYFMDIGKLRTEMTAELKATTVDDYVFASFLLGNDFLPHFPGLCIRKDGMKRVISALREISGSGRRIICGGEVDWSALKALVAILAGKEVEAVRSRGRKKFSMFDGEDISSGLPILDRRLEKSIGAGEPGWEDRYYKALLSSDPTPNFKNHLCLEYCRTLEWCFCYYTGRDIGWTHCFRFHYPPLLSDLRDFLSSPPVFGQWTVKASVPPLVQLAFVLPPSSRMLLPKGLSDELAGKSAVLTRMTWAYCRYFWESHFEFEGCCLRDVEDAYARYASREGLRP